MLYIKIKFLKPDKATTNVKNSSHYHFTVFQNVRRIKVTLALGEMGWGNNMNGNINPLLPKIITQIHRPQASVSWVSSSKSHNKSLNHKTWLREKSTSEQVTLELSILTMSSQPKPQIWLVLTETATHPFTSWKTRDAGYLKRIGICTSCLIFNASFIFSYSNVFFCLFFLIESALLNTFFYCLNCWFLVADAQP